MVLQTLHAFTQLYQNLAGFWVQTSPELPPSSWVEPIFRAKLESHLGTAAYCGCKMLQISYIQTMCSNLQ